MRITLVRHATVLVSLAGRRLLVDPMLDPAGARPPVPDTPNQRRNPLVELPMAANDVVDGVDAVLVTHLHQDHFDAAAAAAIDKDVQLLCQPEDLEELSHRGFGRIQAVLGEAVYDAVRLMRTGGRHGTGAIADALAPVSGFVLRAAGEPVTYLAGDTVWCEEVAAALDRHRPEVVVVNAGGARFLEGDPITMTAADVAHVARAVPEATIVAVHLEAINHCLEDRAQLRAGLEAEGVAGRVRIPADGQTVVDV
jgi:L-ascorbate metabolism protein UlaG (beta-lactamase superfamily)